MEHRDGAYDSPVICLFGKSGTGKSLDTGLSFSTFLFIAAPGALSSIKKVAGYTPAQQPAADLDQALSVIKQNGKNNNVNGIVFDDFCWIAERQREKIQGKGRMEQRHWGILKEKVSAVRNAARHAGFPVIFNCWEGGPKMDNKTGQLIRGGPDLTGKGPEQLSALCDVVLRCGINSMAPKGRWKGIYRCHLDSQWIMKDRFNIGSRMEELPQNIGEILRASGWIVPRHPDLDWQEDMVEALSLKMLEITDPTASNQLYTDTLSALGNKVGHPIAYWTVRDAYDRHIIKRGLALS